MGVTIDRRRSSRFYVNEPVEVCVLEADTSVSGHILDISRNGVGILVPTAVAEGNVVEIRSKRLRILAEIRHCRESADGFSLGLEFCHEILSTEIQSVRTHQPIPPEPPASYLEKLPKQLKTIRGGRR